MKNKKGYIQDFIFFGVIILILAIIIVFGSKLNTDLNIDYQNSSAGSTAKLINQNMSDRFTGIFDYIFITVFIIFGIAIMASMFLLDTHPVLFFSLIIIFAFIILVMAIIGNVYDEFSDNDNISVEASKFTVMGWFMDNFVIAILVFGFLGIILLFAKLREGVFR